MRARAKRNGYQNGTKYNSLESQLMFDKRVQHHLPTPNAQDWNTEWTPEQKQACLERRAAEGKTAYPSKFNALKQMAFEELLPTPQASEGEKYCNTFNPNSQMGQSLSALAGSGLLPTPTARDEKNPSSPDGKRIARKIEKGYTIELNDLAAMGSLPTPDSSQKTAGGAFRLSPLFTEEMMGFPSLWTTLPYLRQGGEPKASKPTETQ